MAISVNWGTKVITVNKADMVLVQTVPSDIYQLDLDYFRLTLKDLEDDVDGMAYVDTHQHNTSVTVGGAILARVVEIINGYTVTFEDGQYAVNLVGANSNVGDVINVNQVSVRSSNSAGLQDLNSLQAASFDGSVAVAPSSSFTGTRFPVGTRAYPVNNLTDAHAIAIERGINKFSLMESITLTGEIPEFSAGFVFIGDSPVTCLVTVDTSSVVTNAEFQNLTVQGTLDGNNVFKQCVILDIDFFNGFLFECSLMGTATLGGGVQANIFNCYSGIAGGGAMQYPVVDFNGNEGNKLALRNYSGGIGLVNCDSSAATASIDMASGRIVIEPSVTAGGFWIRGVGDLYDSSTGTAVVYDRTEHILTASEVIPHVWAASVTG